MFPLCLLALRRERSGPDILHLLPAVPLLHELIVEEVPGLFLILLRPEEGLRAVGKAPAGEIRWRIGLLPGNIVDDLEALLLEGHADAVDVLESAAHPYCAVWSHDPFAEPDPAPVELMVLLN